MPIRDWCRGSEGRAAAFLLAVFFAGGGAGYFLGQWRATRTFEQERAARLPSLALSRRARYMQRLQKELALRTDQRERMNASLRRYHEEMMKIRSQVHPRIRVILQEATRELRTYLDPGQRKKFDSMVVRFRERRRRWRERMRRSGPRGGGGHMMGGPRRGRRP